MDYVIRAFNEQQGQITVEFDGKWTFAVDLPIENGLYPTGDALREVIMHVAPTYLLEREQQNKVVTNAAEIAALVVPVLSPAQAQIVELDLAAAQESDIAFIKEVVTQALAERGL